MQEARLEIAALGVRLTGDDSLRQALLIPGMREFLAPDAKADIEIALDQSLHMPKCRLLHEFDIADGVVHCRFGTDADGVYYYEFLRCGLLRYDARVPGRVELTPMTHPAALRFALWTAFAMAALPLGAVPVHSSVVVCDGAAVMCLGESGTGKSTHTRLWLENIPRTHLLNDDSPIVRFADGEVFVYGSPWSGKTHCYLPERHPIAGLLRLEQRPANTIRRLGTVESFAALQPSCPPAMAREERCMDLLVQLISNIIERVPVYRMGCLPDADAARLSHQTLMPCR